MIGIIPPSGTATPTSAKSALAGSAGEGILPPDGPSELLPLGSRKLNGVEYPKAVSEHLVERMIAAGAEQICFVISPQQTELIKYFAAREYSAQIFYVVQEEPRGLCDALFRAAPFAEGHELVMMAMPCALWFPENGYRASLHSLAGHTADVDLLLFPVPSPEAFDSVVCDENGYVQRIDVKDENPESHWVWGACTTTGEALQALRRLWEARHEEDQNLSHLLNAFIGAGNAVRGTHAGEVYLDITTEEGHRKAQEFLSATKKAPKARAGQMRRLGNALIGFPETEGQRL